jgi:hypothetical protein
MRRLLCLLPLLLAATDPAPRRPNIADRDPGVASLASDAEDRWVPFDLTPGNQIRFAMNVDGRALTAILDTGVSYSVLARRSPAFDASKAIASGSATAIGGAVAIAWMPTRTMVVGGLTRTGGGISVADLPAVATGSATAVDLLVGRDLIGGQALDIDYAAHRFRLIRSGRMPFRGQVAPLRISAERRVYESELTLGGQRLKPMVVDTGDGSAITVTSQGWASAGMNALPTTTALSFGLAGPVVSGLAVVPTLEIGELRARSVEVRIEPADGFSQSIGTAGRIGSGFLQNYRVLLDPGAGHMVLSAGPTADRPPLRSTTGILAGILKDRIRVLHVMKNSPAEQAGWKQGELICSVNGQPITPAYPTSSLANWSIAAPGTVIALGTCDGGTRPLTARAFY